MKKTCLTGIIVLSLLLGGREVMAQSTCSSPQTLSIGANDATCNSLNFGSLGQDMDNTGITTLAGSQTCGAAVNHAASWYTFTGDGTTIRIKIFNQNNASRILVFQNASCTGSITPVQCANFADDGQPHTLDVNTVNGATYKIAVLRQSGSATMSGSLCAYKTTGSPYSSVCDPTFTPSPLPMTVQPDVLACFTNFTKTVSLGNMPGTSDPFPFPASACGTGQDWLWGTFTATSNYTNFYYWGKHRDNMEVSLLEGPCAPTMVSLFCQNTGTAKSPTWAGAATVPGKQYYVIVRAGNNINDGRMCVYGSQTPEPTKPYCQNDMSFESGTGAGWTARSGPYRTTTGWQLTNPGSWNTPKFELTMGGCDPIVSCALPKVAPGGGTRSFRIGTVGTAESDGTYAAAASMEHCFTVTPQNAGFGYKYAVVMDYVAHAAYQQPEFQVYVESGCPNGSMISCGNFTHQPNDGVTKFQFVGDDSDVNAQTDGPIFSPWKDVAMDLSGFIGQQVKVTFRVKDCSGGNTSGGNIGCNAAADDCGGGSHWAYAYFDTYCIPMAIAVPEFCAGTGSVQICAPAGYQTYSWPVGQPGLNGPLNTQCVTISNPVAGTTYTVNMTSITGCPTSIQVKIKNIPATKTNDTTVCVPFSGSIPLSVTVTNPLNPPYTYSWSHGLGSNTTANVNPTATTTYSVTIRNNSGCTSQEIIKVTVQTCGLKVNSTGGTICQGKCMNITATGSGGIAPYTYAWQPGSLSGVSVNVCPASTTTYTVIMNDGAGGAASATTLVTVNPIPVITASPSVICAGQSTNLSASGGNTYTWNPGNSSSNPYSVTPAVTTTYTVTGTSAAGCTNSAETTITVNPNPAISVTPTSICVGQSTSLTASGATNYSWMPGSLTGTTVNVNPAVTTTYTVTGETAGCTGTTTVVVTVNTSATITINPVTLCQGASTTLTANGATNYTWMPGGTTGNTLSITPASSITYTVTGITATGCSGTTTVNVTVNPNPVIISSDLLMCKDSIRMMSASGGTGYTWMPGGQTGSTITLSPTAVIITTYTITGVNAFGCTGSTTAVLTVVDCSIPSVTVNNPVICTGACANLTGTGIGGAPPLTYQWTPNIGAGAGSHNVCPVATTSYTVIVTDSKGDSDTAVAVITVNPLPNVTATGSTVCAGQSGTLTAGGATTYTWQPSGLTGSPINQNPPATTNYTVTGTDVNGCINTAVTSIIVNPNPTITATGGLICQGQSTPVSASGATSYVWTPATGLSNPNIANPVASPVSTTTYTISGTDANGCSNTTTAVVIVEQIPTLSASSQSICAGSNATLSASGAVSYTWLPNNTTGNSLTDSPATSTTYTIIGATLAGCTNSTTTSITVNPIPVVNFEPDTAGCSPVNVTFINNSTGVISSTCVWDFGNGKTYTGCLPPAQVYTNTGTQPKSYSVTLTVTSNGCSSSLTRPNIITVYPLPKAGFTANPWETEIMEPTIIFTNTSTGDSIRIWNFGDGTTDNGNNPSHVYEDTGHYNVCLSIQNAWGCTDNICQTVIIKPVWSFYIPNAFTPNGDGINDTFNGKGENIVEYKMYIYDRWGNEMFESNSTQKDWDGRANGGSDIAQEDVYVYVVLFKDAFDKKHKLTGAVALIK